MGQEALGHKKVAALRERQAAFLDRLAEGAVVTAAARGAGFSPASAYNYRARCPYFAAGWEAAISLARAPLADALYERAVLGVTATYRRDEGEVERHSHDNRLAMAVLARLDKRDADTRHTHLPWRGLMRDWQGFLLAFARADFEAIEALMRGEVTACDPAGDRLVEGQVDSLDVHTPATLLPPGPKRAALYPNSLNRDGAEHMERVREATRPCVESRDPASDDSMEDQILLAGLLAARQAGDDETPRALDEYPDDAGRD